MTEISRSATPSEPLPDFNVLYKKWFPAVAGTVASFRFTNGHADELIQDTFVKAWDNRDRLKSPEAFGSWIKTIARNNCLKAHRRNRIRHVPVSETDFQGEDDQGERSVVLVADDQFASLHWEHSISLLRKLIVAHEGEPRATVARMFYIEERSVKEISGRLNMKPNTVLSHLRRFRLLVSKAMVNLLEKEGMMPGSN